MNTIRLVDTKEVIGTLTDDELEEIIEALEEESAEDQDYYIDPETIDFMETIEVSPKIIEMLRTAIAGKEAIEIEWVKA